MAKTQIPSNQKILDFLQDGNQKLEVYFRTNDTFKDVQGYPGHIVIYSADLFSDARPNKVHEILSYLDNGTQTFSTKSTDNYEVYLDPKQGLTLIHNQFENWDFTWLQGVGDNIVLCTNDVLQDFYTLVNNY